MNNEILEEIFTEVSDSITGDYGAWQFLVDEVFMLCFTDESNNRMRIISPVAEMNDITDVQIGAAMEANFHSALDVRYAISDGVMWVAFIHPLKELTSYQVFDALIQVYSGAVTFGETYTSTSLTFPKAPEDPSVRYD